MKHGRSTIAALIVGLVIVVATGCSPWATYPPVEIKPAKQLTRESWEPVPTVMAVAVQYARDTYTKDQDLAINLPEGTPALVYDKVIAKVGEGRPLRNAGEPAIHIKEVRTRGFDAQVDLVYARPDGMHQLVTLTLNRTVFQSWRVVNARPWQLRDFTPPAPNYVPPPVDEKAVAEEAATTQSETK